MSQREPKHRPIHHDDEQDRDRFRRRYKRKRDTAAETPDSVDDPAEWFETIIQNQILPHVDTGESELQLSDKDLSAVDVRRFRLELRHPDTCVSDVSLAYDAGEFEAYLRGLQHGLDGRIEQKSEHRECVVCGDDLGDRVGNYCSTDCAVQHRNE
jgi:hypothetical protein